MGRITLDLRRLRRPLAEPAPPELAAVRAAVAAPGGREPPVPRYPPVTVSTEQRGRTLVLVVDGDVDLHTAPAVRQAVESALSRRPWRLVVDLSLVQFLNSAGLEALLAARRQAAPHTDLRLVAATQAVWRPIQITRLHEQLVIHTSRAEAIAAPARRGDDDRSAPVETHRPVPSHESAPS